MVQKMMSVISVVPVEMAMEKLNTAHELLDELESVYPDSFSVNHAMRRLQGLCPVALEYELRPIRLNAADPNLARAHIVSVIPVDKRQFLKPLVDTFDGMTIEQMLHRLRIADNICPNILGIYGPHLSSPRPGRKPATVRIPSQRPTCPPLKYYQIPPDADEVRVAEDVQSPSKGDAGAEWLGPEPEETESAPENEDVSRMYGTWGDYMQTLASGVAGVASLGFNAYNRFQNLEGVGFRAEVLPNNPPGMFSY